MEGARRGGESGGVIDEMEEEGEEGLRLRMLELCISRGEGSSGVFRPSTSAAVTTRVGRRACGLGVELSSRCTSMMLLRLEPPRPRFIPNGGKIENTSRSSSVSGR